MPSMFETTAGAHIGPVTGGAVTQTTNKATAVTLNAESGLITTSGASLAGDNIVAFVVNNSTVSAGDVILVNHTSGGYVGGYLVQAVEVADGQFKISILNLLSSPLNEVIVLSFVIFKGASS